MNILIPRNIEQRASKKKLIAYKHMQQEIIEGDLVVDDSFSDIKNVKTKVITGSLVISYNNRS